MVLFTFFQGKIRYFFALFQYKIRLFFTLFQDLTFLVCVAASRVMPTFTTGRPQRAKRFFRASKIFCRKIWRFRKECVTLQRCDDNITQSILLIKNRKLWQDPSEKPLSYMERMLADLSQDCKIHPKKLRNRENNVCDTSMR